MYCRNCGNKVKDNDKFCDKCGSEIVKFTNNGENNFVYGSQQNISTVQQPINGNQKPKNKKIIAIAIIIPIAIILFIVGIMAFVFILTFGLLGNESSKEYVDLDGDKIPTIYKVIGEKRICNVNSSSYDDEVLISYEYCDGELSNNEYDEYIDYLTTEENFMKESSYSLYTLTKESIDDGMFIVIEIDKYSDVVNYYKENLMRGNI